MKVGIVGSGLVGATAAYAMIFRGVCRRIVLVDKDAKRAGAEADDLRHAVPFSNPVQVSAGDYSDLKDARLVILTAGVSQKPGETRLDLLKRNAAVFKEVVPKILKHASDAILLVATNPVDLMTHLAARYASDVGGKEHRVVGSGTLLDTARFRTLLSRRIGVDPHHIHAYVIGEHGDSEVISWSTVNVAGMPLRKFRDAAGMEFKNVEREEIEVQVRNAAYRIIEGKGSTHYGVGGALAQIASSVLRDQRSVLTVSGPTDCVPEAPTVALSLPRVVGGDGIIHTISMPLNDGELEGLQRSARILREHLDELDKAMS
jgi:L-lactate dehydrogenase